MKEIKAIIQPFLVERVLSALDGLEDLPGLTVSEILGWGRLPERKQHHDVVHAGHGMSKKVKLEIVVREEQVALVMDALAAAAHTGNAGDGKIFVVPVEQARRIRTGEAGPEAL